MSKIGFEGIGEVMATFLAKTGLAGGQMVQVTGSGEAGKCNAGDHFCGIAVAVEGGLAAVQLAGFAVLPTSGAVGTGWVKLAADGNGGVKADPTNGKEYLVAESDTAAATATVLL